MKLLSSQSQHGLGLPITLFLMLILVSIGTWLLQTTTEGLRQATQFRKIKASTSLANTVITDILRQFSQEYQGDHYSTAALERDPTFYNKGYSVITTSANTLQHFVSFEAVGSYGTDINNPQARKEIQGVIKFISDLTTYGTMWQDAFTTSANNATYQGKLWANNGWTISGDNCIVNGGPVFVNGNIATSGGGDIVINGDLYRSGSRSGNITVTGNDNTYIPDLTWPTIDTTYFDTYSNVKVTANTTVRFSYETTASTGSVRIGTTTYTIPSTGFIIYGQNCVLTTSGTVRGRVTIASLRTSGSSGGNVTVDNNLSYATVGSTSNANVNDALAVISTHGQTWTRAASGQYRYMSGVFWVDTGGTTSQVFTLSGGSTSSGLKFFGTRNKAISGTVSLGASINYDTGLDTYPPPGLPEKPCLVSYQIK